MSVNLLTLLTPTSHPALPWGSSGGQSRPLPVLVFSPPPHSPSPALVFLILILPFLLPFTWLALLGLVWCAQAACTAWFGWVWLARVSLAWCGLVCSLGLLRSCCIGLDWFALLALVGRAAAPGSLACSFACSFSFPQRSFSGEVLSCTTCTR